METETPDTDIYIDQLNGELETLPDTVENSKFFTIVFGQGTENARAPTNNGMGYLLNFKGLTKQWSLCSLVPKNGIICGVKEMVRNGDNTKMVYPIRVIEGI